MGPIVLIAVVVAMTLLVEHKVIPSIKEQLKKRGWL
jgi:type II secretory pathway component PulF